MTGHIVWLMGPFPAGDWNDITIFRFALKHMLEEHERVEADDGYRGENPGAAKIPGSQYHNHDKKQKKVRGKVRSRQEGVNRLFKLFKILDGRFDHDMGIHGIVVRAVVVLVQLSLENGFLSVFDVSEYEDPQPNTSNLLHLQILLLKQSIDVFFLSNNNIYLIDQYNVKLQIALQINWLQKY